MTRLTGTAMLVKIFNKSDIGKIRYMFKKLRIEKNTRHGAEIASLV